MFCWLVNRYSLFVLSQYDRLAGERQKLIDFLKVLFTENNIKLNILVAKRKTGPNGSGDFECFSKLIALCSSKFPTEIITR